VPIKVAPVKVFVVFDQIVKFVISVPDTRLPTVVKLMAEIVVEVDPCASLKEKITALVAPAQIVDAALPPPAIFEVLDAYKLALVHNSNSIAMTGI
jgi:hypothetical protein